MGHVDVHIWTGKYVDSSFLQRARDTVDLTLDPQLNFDIDVWKRDNDFDTNGDSWSDVKADFIPYVKNKLGNDPPDNQIHMILIDDIFSQIGAGKAWGQVQASPTPWDTGEAAACGVNVALKTYVNNNCLGDGGKAYDNTVMQEILHTLLDGGSIPNTDESSSGNDFPASSEHSCGKILYDANGSDDWVSPMQTWYSYNNCGDNYTVDSNCNLSETITREGYSDQLSSCTKDEVNDYHSYFE